MRIVICGGGGLGHTCAGILSNCKGVTVDMLTNHPEKWNHEYRINLPDGSMLTGKTEIISNNPADVIPSADWVFLCVPSYLVEQTLLRIRPHIRPETVIGSVVGHAGTLLVGIAHGTEGGSHRLQHVGVGGSVVLCVQSTEELKGGA